MPSLTALRYTKRQAWCPCSSACPSTSPSCVSGRMRTRPNDGSPTSLLTSLIAASASRTTHLPARTDDDDRPLVERKSMTREALAARTFVRLIDSLVEDFDVIDLLTVLANRTVELLDVEAAGILLADPDGRLRVMAASNEEARL